MSWKWSTLLVLVSFTCLMVVYYGRAIHKDTARIAQAQQDRLLHIPLRTIKSNYVQGMSKEINSTNAKLGLEIPKLDRAYFWFEIKMRFE